MGEMMDMRGRIAMVTGAAGHLGRTMSATLAELGFELVLVDRSEAVDEALATAIRDRTGSKVSWVACDLESEESRVAMIRGLAGSGRGMNCLVNNAAFVGTSALEGWAVPFAEQSLNTWRRAFEVNLTAAFHLSQAFAPLLADSEGGNIINIASIYGEYGPDWALYEGTSMSNPAAYGASKGGLIQFTRWLATTLSPNVRVNAIAPGGIFRNQPASFVERYVARTPLRRMATEEDFRGTLAYLATDLSSYVTGQVLKVDGGWGVW